jgi:hypothetical protein
MCSPDGDLTINQKRILAWDSWTGGGITESFEDKLAKRRETNDKRV